MKKEISLIADLSGLKDLQLTPLMRNAFGHLSQVVVCHFQTQCSEWHTRNDPLPPWPDSWGFSPSHLRRNLIVASARLTWGPTAWAFTEGISIGCV